MVLQVKETILTVVDRPPDSPDQSPVSSGTGSQKVVIQLLISAPLLNEDKSSPVEALDIQKEIGAIVRSLEDLPEQISVEIIVDIATSENLHRAFTRKPKPLIIHFIGHGILANQEAALVLEDNVGIARLFSERELSFLLDNRQEPPCQIALLNACYSEKFANALINGGVPHIIAINGDDTVLDPAARCFSQHFYRSLFSINSVSDGFIDARRALLVNDDLKKLFNPQTLRRDINLEEYYKFHLLPKTGSHGEKLDITPYGRVQAPQWENTNLPQIDNGFVGRRKDLHYIAEDISKYSCVHLHGMGGIGKTTLANAAGRWHHERKHFRNGVWIVELRTVKLAVDARSRLLEALELSDNEIELGRESNAALVKVLSQSERLLILDDLDQLIQHDEEGLVNLLNRLLDCRRLKLLLTSREDIPSSVRHHHREVQKVTRAEAILIFKSYSPPLENWQRNDNQSQADFEEVINLLDGYPLPLRLAASYLNEQRCDIKLLKESLLKALEASQRKRKDRDTSLYIALDVSYNVLPQAAKDLFPILAIFPGGLSEDLAAFIWGKDSRDTLVILLKYSMAEQSDSKNEMRVTLPEPARLYAQSKQLRDNPMEILAPKVLHYFYDYVKKICHQTEMAEISEKEKQLQLALERTNLKHYLYLGYQKETSQDGICRSARITFLLGNDLLEIFPGNELLKTIEHGIACARRCNDKLAEADLFYLKGNFQKSDNATEESKISYIIAIELYRSIAVSEVISEVDLLLKIAQVWVAYPNTQEALRLNQEALISFDNNEENFESANVKFIIGDLLKKLSNNFGALRYYEDALHYYQFCNLEKQIRLAESRIRFIIRQNERSDRGVDYTQLESFLSQEKWKEADQETYLVMLKIVGRSEGDYFRLEEISTLPCTDLSTIDQLWVKYSQGRFGFSVQKRIYYETGNPQDGSYDSEAYRRFGDRVGWRVNSEWIDYERVIMGRRVNSEWIDYEKVIFSTSAPEGHLPVPPGILLGSLFSRRDLSTVTNKGFSCS